MTTTREDRQAEHRRWLASLQLSTDDWRRIKLLAEDAAASRDGGAPALVDLSQPLRIAAVQPWNADHYSGRLLGVWAGQALLMWRMTNRERESWARRRGAV